MCCFVTTTPTSTTSWRKQHGALHMPPPLSPSNEQRMGGVHGLPLPANMLGKTSGRPRSRNKSNCCIPVDGKARVTSCSNTLSPNTATHMYQCQHVQNMFNTNCPSIHRCRILGLTTLNSLLQYINWLVWEVCSVN